ncbi:hypothetical protein [Hymenobacter coccineus]|uniref:Uncharacterized protein n=1 Tax=Hymenobacter coccineus TaxID=1908235 RepID=A0A1G1SU63_9BACT|nr:hypothetical protein [Hymenobacter coccineus]OGX82152.1 hypothetical protein BEN49_14395 [Hymenobacter coccineus]
MLYGPTRGLLTVATWQNYTVASGIASQEAAALAVRYPDPSGYPFASANPCTSRCAPTPPTPCNSRSRPSVGAWPTTRSAWF